MGSLMAGWDSPIRDLKSGRNRSLTKGEIANFWRLKKIEEEDLFFLKASYRHDKVCFKPCIMRTTNALTCVKADQTVVYDGSETIPTSLIVQEEENMEPLLKKHGWWISSKWAFLNEPPKTSWKGSYNYVAQFHIAQKHRHKHNFNLQPTTDGIVV